MHDVLWTINKSIILINCQIGRDIVYAGLAFFGPNINSLHQDLMDESERKVVTVQLSGAALNRSVWGFSFENVELDILK